MTHAIDALFEVIEARKDADAGDSYVASLFQKGTGKISQKLGEEAFEAVIEAMKGDREALKQESADLLFHLMVLWADQNLKPTDVFEVLESRMGLSGLEEKKRRTET